VAVKILRNGVAQEISTDKLLLKVVKRLVPPSQKSSAFAQGLDLLEEFYDNLEREIDFEQEAVVQKWFYQRSRQVGSGIMAKVPKVLYSCQDLIIQEYVDTISIKDHAQSLPKQARKALADQMMVLFLEQLLADDDDESSYCHGDPHLGNVRYCKETGQLVLFDFGNHFTVPENELDHLRDFVSAMVFDPPKAIGPLKKLGCIILNETKMVVLLETYAKYLRSLDSQGLIEYFAATSEEGLPVRIAPLLNRIGRCQSIIEGACLDIDKDWNYTSVFLKYFTTLFFDEHFLEQKAKKDLKEFTEKWL
jgi:predicted unusual protein kinase regulating ubiquinone biosynthesis (AarF/ABC1/UbiB family)